MFCFLLDRTFQGYVIICYKQITVHSCSFHLFFGFVWLCFTWRQQSWQRRILCLCVYMYLCVCVLYIYIHIYIHTHTYTYLLSSTPHCPCHPIQNSPGHSRLLWATARALPSLLCFLFTLQVAVNGDRQESASSELWTGKYSHLKTIVFNIWLKNFWKT